MGTIIPFPSQHTEDALVGRLRATYASLAAEHRHHGASARCHALWCEADGIVADLARLSLAGRALLDRALVREGDRRR